MWGECTEELGECVRDSVKPATTFAPVPVRYSGMAQPWPRFCYAAAAAWNCRWHCAQCARWPCQVTLSGSAQDGQLANHSEPHSVHLLSNDSERRRGLRACCKSTTKRQEALPHTRKCCIWLDSLKRADTGLGGVYLSIALTTSVLLLRSTYHQNARLTAE